MKYYINERAWEVMITFLKQTKGIHSHDEASLRKFIEAIWFVNQWRLLLEHYGYWHSIYRRFKRWVEQDICKN